jgi:hypothetical protein
MLFVPAGVGVIAYLDLLKLEFVPIVAAVIGGTAITIFVTAIVANRFAASASKVDTKVSAEVEEVAGDVNSQSSSAASRQFDLGDARRQTDP